MPGFGRLKTIGVYCPPELRGSYGVASTRFDGQGYLLLPVDSESISSEDTYLGETGMLAAWQRLHYQGARRVIRGYSFTLVEPLPEIFYLLEHLASQAAANPFQPVVLRDWVRPERADWDAARIAQTEAVTQRQGVILDLVLTQGLIRSTKGDRDWLGEGFSFRFQEAIARAI
jgi:hypothetical protein